MSLSIKDIARLSGVSTATVSRALSQPERVSEETRRQVMAVVEAHGYRINSMARNLRRKRADAVLAIAPNLANPFFSAIFDGMQEVLLAHGKSLLITDSRSSLKQRRSLLSHWREARVDGLISLDGQLPDSVLAELSNPDLAGRVVFACEWPVVGAFPSVRSDNRHGMHLAVDHLVGLGHRDIAYLAGPVENVLNTERQLGVTEALAHHGLNLPEDRVLDGDFSLEAGQKAAARLAALSPRPSAVICASDQLAIGLTSGLHDLGISVPDGLSLVGFDDIATSSYFIPPLTTIRQDRRGLGARAATRLLEGLDGQGPRTDTAVLPVTLEVRASTAAVG